MFSSDYIDDLIQVLHSFPHAQFERLVEALLDARRNDQQIFVMGNGGSGAAASHFACDINKGCSAQNRKRFRMISLTDNMPTILAYANDYAYDDIFIEQMKNFFGSGDLVIGISGSGNSENVLRAIAYANANCGLTAGLCGFDGGKLAGMVQIPIWIESNDMQKVEDLHVIVTHMLMQRLQKSVCAEETS